jgi:hypothetical protein
MNGYICFYRGESIETRADSSLEAQTKTAAWFQKKNPRRKVRGYEITVKLAEKDGQPITHTAVD